VEVQQEKPTNLKKSQLACFRGIYYIYPVRYVLILSLLCFYSCHNPEQVDPIVRTGEVQNIGLNNGTLVGNLEDPGVAKSWVYGFVWSDQPGPNVVSGTTIVLGERDGAGAFSANLENLSTGTTYYVKAFVSDDSFKQIFYGAQEDFKTLQ